MKKLYTVKFAICIGIIVLTGLIIINCSAGDLYSTLGNCSENASGKSSCDALKSRCHDFKDFIDSSSYDGIGCACCDK